MEQRTNRKKKKVYHIRKFRVFMLCYVCIFVIALVVGLTKLYGYLKAYEKSLPIHTIEAFMPTVNDEYYNKIIDESMKINPLPFENEETVLASINRDSEAKHTYTYKKKNDEFTEEKPVYLIKADSKGILKVTLAPKTEKADYDFPIWEIEKVEPVVDVQYNAGYNVTATLPGTAILKINGIPVGDEYITENNIKTDKLSGIDEYVTQAPYLKKYTVNGLYCRPEVTAVIGNGITLTPTSPQDGTFVFDFPVSAELKQQNEAEVLAMENAYINYMINVNDDKYGNFQKLAKYLFYNTPSYKLIRSCEVGWNNSFDKRTDNLISADNFIYYSDECFSCETKFSLTLKKGKVENEYKGNIRWTYVLSNGKWLAVKNEFLE